MRTTWMALWCGVAAACGGAANPAVAPRADVIDNAGPDGDDGLAWLPPGVRTVASEPKALLAPSANPETDGRIWTLGAIGGFPSLPCWPSLYHAITAWYTVGIDGDDSLERDVVRLVRASWTPAQTADCLAAPGMQRTTTGDPRITAWVWPSTEDFDEDGIIDPPTPGFALVWLDDGWIGVAHDEAHVAPLLHRPTADEHPLRPLIRAPFATEVWVATAVDYTGDLLGVPSLGARVELADREGTGEVHAQFVFADAATAQRAMTALRAFAAMPPDEVVFAEGAATVLARFEGLGKLSIEGTAIAYRGTITFDDMLAATNSVFAATSRPVPPRR